MSADNTPSPKISGIYFLSFILLVYLFLLSTNPSQAVAALRTSGETLAGVLPVLVVVLLLLSLISYLFAPKKISNYLGKGSGFKGCMISVAGGILSHGPAYIWFPMLSELRSRGTKTGLIATFIYVRAIKLPWLPLMAELFGWSFTLIICSYLILGGIVQGLLIDWCDR